MKNIAYSLFDYGNIRNSINIKRILYFSTSANPLHNGHINMMNYAVNAKKYKDNIFLFEITVNNADKGIISSDEINRRLEQFKNINKSVLITNLSTFEEKSHLFNKTTFIIGTDTLKRIDDNKYYLDNEIQKYKCFTYIAKQECDFLVFPRYPYKSGKEIAVSEELSKLCIYIEDVIDGYEIKDISSTQIRNQLVQHKENLC